MSRVALPTFAAVLLAAASPAIARTVLIEHTTPGAVFNGILDGFPGLYGARDGNGDLDGQPLSVVRKGNVTEVRSILEVPLASALAGVAPGDVVTATLTFNIDDVIPTLRPPDVDLDGRAAANILVHFYDGDGVANLADFKRTGELATNVPTAPPTITDQTLEQSGAVFFTVDATARVVSALTAGQAFLGVLWRTNDSATGTSLDDGRAGSVSGEPTETSAGSRMPFLTIEVNDAPPPGCGNGEVGGEEQCDDGNTADGDCCSRLCRYETSGSTCSDGDACTDADACNGAGSCVAGGPKNCDDGSICTTDACAAATGCVHEPANQGAACTDAGQCVAGAVCTAGACVGTPIEGSCDDGNACTSDDACQAGACVGAPVCGNGAVDASCGEECDDGNTADVDGCSSACAWNGLVDGAGSRECLVAIAFQVPTRNGTEVVRDQTCTDGAACDTNPAPDVCGFVVAACVGQPDPRVAGCTAPASLAPAVVRPGRGRAERTNRGRLSGALAQTPVPGCSVPVQVDVAVRRRGAKVKPGTAKVILRAKAKGVGRDRDMAKLVCEPAS